MEHNIVNLTFLMYTFAFWTWNTLFQLAKYNNGTAINDPCSEESLLTGFSSLEECHQIIIATSVCKPRKLIYMTFLLLVPVFILFCAQFWLPTYIAYVRLMCLELEKFVCDTDFLLWIGIKICLHLVK